MKDSFNKDTAEKIGGMIKEARIKRDITQTKLASIMNTTQSSIARIEKGVDLPTLSYLIKVAKSLGVKLIPPSFEMGVNLNAKLDFSFKAGKGHDLSSEPKKISYNDIEKSFEKDLKNDHPNSEF